MDKERDAKIIELYKSGLTQKEVGKKMGFTQSGVGYILKKYNIKSQYIRIGENNPNWKRGIMFDRGRKLIYSPNHPYPDFLGKYCYEYRLIMEKHLGRFLTKNEVVHHINGDVTDNRIENLQVMSREEHIRIHKNNGDMKRDYSNKYNFSYTNEEEYKKLYNEMYQEKNKERLIEYRKNKWKMKKEREKNVAV